MPLYHNPHPHALRFRLGQEVFDLPSKAACEIPKMMVPMMEARRMGLVAGLHPDDSTLVDSTDYHAPPQPPPPPGITAQQVSPSAIVGMGMAEDDESDGLDADPGVADAAAELVRKGARGRRRSAAETMERVLAGDRDGG